MVGVLTFQMLAKSVILALNYNIYKINIINEGSVFGQGISNKLHLNNSFPLILFAHLLW